MHLENLLKDILARFQAIPNEDARALIGTRDFISSLIFCFTRDRGNTRALDGIRKFIQNTLSVKMSRGAFWERLATKKTQKYFRSLSLLNGSKHFL